MAPSFFSWLGNGTSRRGLPVAVRGGPWPCCDGVTSVVAAFDEDVDDIYADGPARMQRSEVAGLARNDGSVAGGNMIYMEMAYL